MSISSQLGAVAIVGLVLGGAVAYAQAPASERLTKATTVRCVFPAMATVNWKNGEPQPEIKAAKLSVGFDNINPDEGTARAIGTFGPSNIIVRLSGGTLHFLQTFGSGPLYMTTVFPEDTRNGNLQAVHTRHEYTRVVLPGFTARPEQYYGECSIE